MASQRLRFLRMLRNCAGILLVLIFIRELIGIVSQYRFYFPPDFKASAFLAGRESFFLGSYRTAFYVHIICGPFAVLISAFLVWSGNRNTRFGLHRILGKALFVIVLLLAPSGLIMATRTYTGMVAGIGFALLAILTLTSMSLALVHIKRGDLDQHRVWAMRLFIMLLSPILLRLISGIAVLTGNGSDELYQFNAWGSWLLPLVVYELTQRIRTGNTRQPKRAKQAKPKTTETLEHFT